MGSTSNISTIGYAGPPVANSGTFGVNDLVTDVNGEVWICTVAGTPGTWVSDAAGGAVILSPEGINSATNGAHVITPTFANGTAAQLSDLTRDYMVYLDITGSSTAFTLAIGPTSTPANTIVASTTTTVGTMYTVKLPAGWYLKWAGTGGAIATQTAISA